MALSSALPPAPSLSGLLADPARALRPWLEPWLGPHIDWMQVVLIALTPLFLLVFAIELQVLRGRGARDSVQWRDVLTNLNLGGAYQVAELIAYPLFVAGITAWIWEHRLFTIPVDGWTILPIFLGVEFCYYWFHRASHRVRWFWSAHVVHHSAEHMNFTTAMRQSVLYAVTGWWVFFTPLMILGVAPMVVFVLYAANLGYQYFVHTETVGRLHPAIEFVFNTPSHHRAHHGRNPQYIDKNYGGVLIVFDRLFGTFEPEVERVDYGVVRRLPEGAGLWATNMDEFLAMWRDVFRRDGRPLGVRLQHLVRGPEWGERTESGALAKAGGEKPAGL